MNSTCSNNSLVSEALHPYLRYQLGVHIYKDWLSLQLVPQSFVEKSVVNLRNEVYDGKETVRIRAVSVDVDESGTPWRFPDELDQSCSNEPEDLDYLSAYSSSLICEGSIVSAKYLSILGMDISEHSNNLYRVEFVSVSLTHKASGNEIGNITRACDLANLINIESSKEFAETADKSIVLADDSMFNQGMLFSIGTSILENIVSSSVAEIICKIPRGPTAGSAIDCRQLFIGITGEEGSGKSHCALHIASRLSLSQNYAVVYMGCRKLQSSSQTTLSTILSELQHVFCDAMLKQPSVLILDDIDSLIPNAGSGDSSDGSIQHQMTNPALISQVKAIVDHIYFLSKSVDGGVACLCTCKDISFLTNRFIAMMHSVVAVPSFDAPQRTEFLCHHLLERATKHQEVPNFISRLGRITDGYRPRDLQMIAKRVNNATHLRDLCHSGKIMASKNPISECDVDSIVHDYIPLSQQSLNILHNENVVDWKSIGGLFRPKEMLHDTVIHPMKFRRVYNNAPTKLPTGVLLFGYPGSGKSYIVPSLAKISNLNMITCRGRKLSTNVLVCNRHMTPI